ncbi:MAG: metalloregulator ArsR/SmtB family transcription factor [Azospirillaceae bacterium]
MDDALRALADGTRRRILSMVWAQERTAGEIAADFEMSRPAVSQHLRVLLDADLVAVRRDGTRRWYRARQDRVAAVRAVIESFWDDRLAALKSAAEAQARADRTDPEATAAGRESRNREQGEMS